jgi:photosystem II stability/assembly factor-like uncharacterized protein
VEGKRLLAAAALLLFCAAAISMARAAAAPFEPEATVPRVDRLALLALARAGDRVLAAGERGRVLVSDDGGHSWSVASTPTYETLTSLAFVDARHGFATGHRGVILRTEDGGSTWSSASIAWGAKPALFAIRMEGARGIAVGAYGAYLESADAGRTWVGRRMGAADFDRHFTGIASCGGGCLMLVGEAGTLLRSLDAGATWEPLAAPYEGSFFGAAGLHDGSVIAFGMRGHAFRSADRGLTWKQVDLGAYRGALQGATIEEDGRVVLTGADGFVAVSRDGVSFSVAALPSRATIAARMLVAGRALCAGPSGLLWAPAIP